MDGRAMAEAVLCQELRVPGTNQAGSLPRGTNCLCFAYLPPLPARSVHNVLSEMLPPSYHSSHQAGVTPSSLRCPGGCSHPLLPPRGIALMVPAQLNRAAARCCLHSSPGERSQRLLRTSSCRNNSIKAPHGGKLPQSITCVTLAGRGCVWKGEQGCGVGAPLGSPGVGWM